MTLKEYPLSGRLEDYTDQELIKLGNTHSSYLDFLTEDQIEPFLARVGHLLTDIPGAEDDIEIDMSDFDDGYSGKT